MPSYRTVLNQTFLQSNTASSGTVTFDDSGVKYSGSRRNFWMKNLTVQVDVAASDIASIVPRRPNRIDVVTNGGKRYPFRFGQTFFSNLIPGFSGMPGTGRSGLANLAGESAAEAAIAAANEKYLAVICSQIAQTKLGSKLKPISGLSRPPIYIATTVLIILGIVLVIMLAIHSFSNINHALNTQY